MWSARCASANAESSRAAEAAKRRRAASRLSPSASLKPARRGKRSRAKANSRRAGLSAPHLHRLAPQILSERRECRRDNAFGIEPGLGIHRRGRVLVNEDVGQHHRAHFEAAVEHAVYGKRLHHMGGKAADGPFLDGDEHLVLAREPKEQLGIEGLGEAGISDGGRKSKRGKLVSRFEAFSKPRAEREQRYFGALAQHAPLADFEGDAFRRQR